METFYILNFWNDILVSQKIHVEFIQSYEWMSCLEICFEFKVLRLDFPSEIKIAIWYSWTVI